MASLKEEVSRLIEQLNESERPLLLPQWYSSCARHSGIEELRLWLGVPTVATWCAADLVPSDDPTYVGRPGSVAARGANFALQNCDFCSPSEFASTLPLPAMPRKISPEKRTKLP